MTAQGENEIEVKNKINRHKKLLAERLEEYIVGYNEDTIEDNILKLLEKNQFTIATAESCTGGLLAGTLINACGISKYLNESYITYSNDAKIKCLGVKEETLLHYGAVSSQTASEMAVGVQKVAGSSIGLATTGIAGPDGGTPTKPVGLVYIGIAIGKDVYTYELHLTGTRQTIRERSVYRALYHLYCLLK
jgi:nicotinamide-nucleotide amidase